MHNGDIARGGDQVGMRADDIAGEISIALGPPLSGVSFHHEVLALNVAKATQLLEKTLSESRKSNRQRPLSLDILAFGLDRSSSKS